MLSHLRVNLISLHLGSLHIHGLARLWRRANPYYEQKSGQNNKQSFIFYHYWMLRWLGSQWRWLIWMDGATEYDILPNALVTTFPMKTANLRHRCNRVCLAAGNRNGCNWHHYKLARGYLWSFRTVPRIEHLEGSVFRLVSLEGSVFRVVSCSQETHWCNGSEITYDGWTTKLHPLRFVTCSSRTEAATEPFLPRKYSVFCVVTSLRHSYIATRCGVFISTG